MYSSPRARVTSVSVMAPVLPDADERQHTGEQRDRPKGDADDEQHEVHGEEGGGLAVGSASARILDDATEERRPRDEVEYSVEDEEDCHSSSLGRTAGSGPPVRLRTWQHPLTGSSGSTVK